MTAGVLRRTGERIARGLRRMRTMPEQEALPVPIGSEAGAGFLERIEGAPLPVVRVSGWFAAPTLPEFILASDQGRRLRPAVASRTYRQDVIAAGQSDGPFCGFRLDFLLGPGEQPGTLEVDGRSAYRFPRRTAYGSIEPHYAAFFSQDAVMGRQSIYGSGPPTDVSPEFKAFASVASGDVLDFGCGNGDLVGFLRARGARATGLELDEPRIRDVLRPEAQSHVVLYPGGVPLPFADGSFDWIVSTEVIEHVPSIGKYVPEFARLLRPGGKLLVTTPDITCIPSAFPAGCVPWHLLEATHINFFTPQSVRKLFAPQFDLEATYCLGSTRFNGYFVPGSIGAIFLRRS